MTSLSDKVLVCYCRFGDNPMYEIGWGKNSELCREYNFNMYCVDGIIPNLSGYFWRFLLYDTLAEFDYYIFRDLDSRITDREVAAVNEWIESGKTLHIMRDHPHHDWPMMGGMWGMKRVPGLNMTDLILDWVAKNPYPEYFGRKDKADGWMTDMFFLRDVIWPMFKDDCLQHDEMFGNKYGETKPFPTKRVGLEYVGETIKADGSVSEEHRQILKDFLDGQNK
jgi:hypothetical protein